MARKMPISRERCTTDTINTLAMPKPTDSATKNRMAVLAVVCAFTAVKNCSLVLIQLSACKPVS